MRDLLDYRHIQEYKRTGKTKLETSGELRICRDAVRKYWDIDEDAFKEKFYRRRKLESLKQRTADIVSCINQNKKISAREIHERLEQGDVYWSYRTTARFIKQFREQYGLRK